MHSSPSLQLSAAFIYIDESGRHGLPVYLAPALPVMIFLLQAKGRCVHVCRGVSTATANILTPGASPEILWRQTALFTPNDLRK